MIDLVDSSFELSYTHLLSIYYMPRTGIALSYFKSFIF